MNPIKRPDFAVVPSISGRRFTFKVTHEDWRTSYICQQSFETEEIAQKAGQAFLDWFNAEADDIERTQSPRRS